MHSSFLEFDLTYITLFTLFLSIFLFGLWAHYRKTLMLERLIEAERKLVLIELSRIFYTVSVRLNLDVKPFTLLKVISFRIMHGLDLDSSSIIKHVEEEHEKTKV